MFDEVEQCARVLRHIGIKKGDCVNLCTAGVPEAIYVVLACSRVGAIANFINPMFSTEQMTDRINDTGSEWILILDAMYDYIKKALAGTCIRNVVIIPATNSIPVLLSKMMYMKSTARQILKERERGQQRYYSWKEFRNLGREYKGEVDVEYEKDTPVVMVYSSGTTGASKGILLTNDGILSTNYNRNIPANPVKRNDCFLTMIPIWFSTGIVISIIIPLINGVTAILEPKFSGECFSKDLRKYKPNMTLTATSLWLYVINDPKMNDADFSNLSCPITGGEKVNEADEIAINAFLMSHRCSKKINKGYGMCELGGTVTSTSEVDRYKTKFNGVGYPIHGVLVSIFDLDTDEELTYGKHGEIRVCSPGSMKGYYKNPEATTNFFKTDAQGNRWGCTGDIGYVDEDGEIYVLGRATDCYHRKNGDKVFFFDIEEKMFDIPFINQCKVVNAMIDEAERLVAHIVLSDDVEDTDAVINELFAHLREELPDYMVPAYYKIRQSMPVHSNGKRDVGALKKDTENLKRFE